MKTKSANGTPSTVAPTSIVEKIDLCAILDACARAGVKRLRFSDVEIDFTSDYNYIAPTSQNAIPDLPNQTTHQTQTAFDPGLVADLKASQLMIDDPHGFEQEMINQQLREV